MRRATIEDTYDIKINYVFFTRLAVLRGLDIMFSNDLPDNDYSTPAACLYENGRIGCEQVILARNYTYKTGKTEDEVLVDMGLVPKPTDM